jgi:hypothetical protein
MGEEIWLVSVKGMNQQHAVIILTKFVAPELIKRLPRQKERMRSFVTLTFVSFVSAFIIGSVYRNIGTPLK